MNVPYLLGRLKATLAPEFFTIVGPLFRGTNEKCRIDLTEWQRMRERAEVLMKDHQCSARDVFVFTLTSEEALVDTIKHGHGHD